MEGETPRLLNALQIREKAGCHQVLPWGEFLLVPCLFLDCMVILSRDLEKVGEIPFPEGTGPRHGVFSRDGKTLYLVSELSNELFALETGSWKTMFHMSVLPGGLTHRKDTAAIRLNERGDRLYVSTRTMDIVSVIGLEGASPRLLQTVSCGGKHPRDMILAGGHILTANRFTNSVVAFEIREDGTIGARTGEATVPGVVCLADAPSERD
jgi:6-phosphogluconolactonase